MTNSEFIKGARKILGVSQQGLADKIKCSVYTVSAWEQDRHQPSGPALRLIERLLAEHAHETATGSEKAAA